MMGPCFKKPAALNTCFAAMSTLLLGLNRHRNCSEVTVKSMVRYIPYWLLKLNQLLKWFENPNSVTQYTGGVAPNVHSAPFVL